MSTGDNLVEAALHWLEFLDYSEQESDLFANAVQMEGGRIRVKAPRRGRPIDDVVLDMTGLHAVGVVRSIAGALDCLAGLVIGVAGLKSSILRADLARARKILRALTAPSSDGERAQARLSQRLETVIASAGPTGWLDWALDFRNMLVHRGRRLTVSQFVPREPVLYGANNRPVPRVRVVRQLPRDPARSDVEVLRDPYSSPVLTEDATETLRGLTGSTRTLVDEVAEELRALWQWRRDNPAAIPQPTEQWRDGASNDVGAFTGYRPGQHPYDPSMLMAHPSFGQRLEAAALPDGVRHLWAGFD